MTTDAVGGVWVYATALSRALCEKGFDVTLVVLGPAPTREQIARLGVIAGLQVEVTDLALEWVDPQGSDVEHARAVLRAIAAKAKPDLIHLNSYREAAFEWPAPVLVVAHSCVLSWWQACHGEQPTESRWRHYAQSTVRGLEAASEWVAPTRAFRDAIAAIHGPSRTGHVIYNGSDVPTGLHADEPFVLAAGRLWDGAKNLASLAAIAPELDWPVRVAGPLQEPASVRAVEIASVECLGDLPRTELLGLMRQAGIFAAPALYEPFGLTVLEAAASGCALVLSNIATFRELWGDAALYVDPTSDDDLFIALQTLCRDRSLRRRMQEAASMRARWYSLNSMVDAYIDTYRRITCAKTRSRMRRSNAQVELRA
jgi:glycosyltransferase involved in cell wall biosynthesis